MAADAQEQRLRAESLEEDPSLADYDLNSDEQVQPRVCCAERHLRGGEPVLGGVLAGWLLGGGGDGKAA